MISVKILLSTDNGGSALHRCLPAAANLRAITSPASRIFYSQLITQSLDSVFPVAQKRPGVGLSVTCSSCLEAFHLESGPLTRKQ